MRTYQNNAMEDNISDDVTIGHTEDVRSTCNSDRPSRRSYKQIYRKDWENNPIFKGWLSSVSCDKYKAECTACNKELLAHRLTLLKHASSAKHLKKVSMVLESTTAMVPMREKDSTAENIHDDDIKTDLKSFEMNGTASNDENTVDILPQLVNLNNISTSHFSDTKMKIDHHNLNNMDKEFAEEMEAQLSQLTAEQVQTSAETLESAVSNIQQSDTTSSDSVPENIASIIIQTDSFVNIPDSSEAINFKQGYVAKNEDDKAASAILCAAAFLSDKIDDSGSTSVINKITTYPLQISTRVTDYSRGVSVSNLTITLYKLTGGKWVCVGESVTDEVGRCNLIPKNDTFFSVGCYKLHYDVAAYYELQNLKSYFPFIEISFLMRSPHETHHIPLMISPNGYTAYRSLDY